MHAADQISRLLAGPLGRIRMMLARAVITLVNDGAKVQRASISLLNDEARDGVERYQNYGFTSNPHPGMEAAVLFLGGERANPVIVAVGDRQYRLKGLKTGEVALYTDEGDYILLGRGNKITAKTTTFTVDAETINLNASQKTNITTPVTNISALANVGGNINGMGEITDDTGSMNRIRQIYNSHTHKENDAGGQTEKTEQRM